MSYMLTIRLMGKEEASKDCQFPPQEDEYEMYLHALVEDINNLSIVARAEVDSEDISCILIETTKTISESLLCEAMKPIFSSFFCQIRYQSLIES